jgi:hypothetical protein
MEKWRSAAIFRPPDARCAAEQQTASWWCRVGVCIVQVFRRDLHRTARTHSLGGLLLLLVADVVDDTLQPLLV